MRQAFEVDLHPDHACGGPLDLHLAVDLDPRTLMSFEDEVLRAEEVGDIPTDTLLVPVLITWSLPPLAAGPDLLVLATDLAGLAGSELPLEVSAVDNVGALSVEGEPQRTLTIVGRVEVALAQIYLGEERLCAVLDRCHSICDFLLDRAPAWLGDV